MNILIIIPNWLGDAIMSTPAIESLAHKYPDAKITLIGSYVAIEALKHHPLVHQSIIDETKKTKNRLYATYKMAKALGAFDMAITFRKNIYASLLLAFTKSPIRIGRRTWYNRLLLTHTRSFISDQHLVRNYHQLIVSFTKDAPHDLRLYIPKKIYDKPTLGINPGATYGSAKRWYPEKFAQVAAHFASDYNILIFGGPTEVDMGDAIEKALKEQGIKNYTNLAGKTSIQELCASIGGCELFITNDSGPMHIAAVYKVPTVAIFGPTNDSETSQWMNPYAKIVRLDLECAPCMQRQCPIKTHDCMKNISAEMVSEALEQLIKEKNDLHRS